MTQHTRPSAPSAPAPDAPTPPSLRLVVAYADNRVIGRDNTLPWRLPGDLAHFKRTTMGLPIIMGRKTWESLGRPLPGRHNIVISRNPAFAAAGATITDSLDAALRAAAAAPTAASAGAPATPQDTTVTASRDAANPQTACIIGGAQIYAQALPLADEVVATEVHADVEGDAHFPPLDPTQWRETQRQPQPEENGLRYDFVVYRRAQPSPRTDGKP